MKTTLKLMMTGILIISLMNACKKEGPQGPEGPQGQAGTNGTNGTNGNNTTPGTITGIVKLYDKNGILATDASGVVVSLAGLANTSTTSANGRYTLPNIPIGTYKVKLTKPGFNYVIQQVYITGNGTVNNSLVTLSELPSESVATFVYTGYNTNTSNYEFAITLKNLTFNGPLLVGLPYSRTAQVNITDTTKTIQYEFNNYTKSYNFANGVANVSISKTDFNNYPATSFYTQAFITSAYSEAIDLNTGLLYYTGFTKPSAEIVFKTL